MNRVGMTFPQSLHGEATIYVPHIVKLTRNACSALMFLLQYRPDRFASLSEVIEHMWSEPDKQPLTAANAAYKAIGELERVGVPLEHRHGFGYRILPEGR